MLPVVALVGRPNVGKSTLFNAMTRSRDALVADMPGVTRDRHYGVCRTGTRPFVVVDTGGLSGEEEGIDGLTAAQVRLAIEEASVLVFVVDARDGLLPQDRTILDELRRSGKPIIAGVNKTDGLDLQNAMAEFAVFGIANTLPLAASHNRGTEDLVASAIKLLPEEEHEEIDPGEADSIRVAIVGRPNAGKSTLINRLLGEDRLIVSNVAGTTRDPIRVSLERDGRKYTLIDTAGVRRKARVEEAVEKFSVIKTLQSMAAAQVVVVMVDARENLADQDLTLIGHAVDEGRALVIAVNKWDGMDSYQREQCQRALERRLQFVDWAKTVFISALHGSGLRELMKGVVRAHHAATKELGSSELTKTLEMAYEGYQPPLVRGHAPKLRFAHPGGNNPPTIVIHGSRTKHIAPAYRRYLENFFRKRFKLEGTPVRILFRDGENPFAGKKNVLTDSQKRKRQRMIREMKKRDR
ncbi:MULTISPECIES: ribosome biogenesis GTPase Der [Dyella]|uniref:ribosome biogenesis GTPase Der n=1 Tax=Dyella TaxID=231454 RepID=UPI000C838D3B|nr:MULTISPECIES: ribosome biogenesis GTPase Der [Dyella]MDR3446823.1 ribosome biogenesis GTPase Der [Dyella sp.]PMQ03140.1 GTPase Der [Dyella sp. AD56]ULU23550.1 ribosome biogenesis GTPase Der [Dyella terrae]